MNIKEVTEIEYVREALQSHWIALVYPMCQEHWDGMSKAAIKASQDWRRENGVS